MKILYILVIFLLTYSESYSQLVNFNKGQNIVAQDINNNSLYLKDIISPFLFNLNWTNVSSNEVITPEKFNTFFNSIKVYKNDASFTLFSSNTEIKIEDFNFNYNLAFETVKSLIPKSCKDLLNKNPSLLNNNGQYLLDFDGFDGSEPPTLVYCDMTINNGGWTNIAVNLGEEQALINSSLIAGQEQALISDSVFGLSNNSQSDTILNGSLVSRYQNSNCFDFQYGLRIKSSILNKLEASEVKFEAKSFSGGGAACGGILRNIDKDPTPIVKYNSFSDYYLAACANDGTAWFHYTAQDYWHFSYKIDTEITNPKIAVLGVTCGAGYHYIQIKSIMVR